MTGCKTEIVQESGKAPNGEVQRGRERHSDVDEKLASWPPLQRRVRQPHNGALYASALIPRQAPHPIPASAPFTSALSLSGFPSSRCLSSQGCLTAKFSGRGNDAGGTVRTARPALRCNAGLGRPVTAPFTPPLLYSAPLSTRYRRRPPLRLR